MKHPHMMKKPRNHAGLAWEGATLSNEFIDVNRMALDDKYGKVGAPLSKRRNGPGPTDGKTIGLFGLGHVSPVNKEGSQDVLNDTQLDRYYENQRFLANKTSLEDITQGLVQNYRNDGYLEDEYRYYKDAHDASHKDVDAHRRFHAANMRDQSVDINWEKQKPISHSTQLKYGVGIGFGIVVLMFAYDRMHTRIRHPQY